MVLRSVGSGVLLVVLVLSSSVLAQADSRALKSAEKYLEVSLQGLQSQADRLVNRNQWLKSQMSQFQGVLSVLNQKVEVYKKVQLGIIDLNSRAYPLNFNKTKQSRAEQRIHRLNREADFYSQEGQSHQRSYKTHYRSVVELQAAVSEARLDIQTLKHRLASLSPNQVPAKLQKRSMDISADLKESQSQVSALAKQLELAEKTGDGGVQEYVKLNNTKVDIHQKVVGLRSEIELLSKHQARLNENWNNLNQKEDGSLRDLSQTIKALKSENEELKAVLAKANKKISRNNIQFNITDDEIEQLMENFYIIKNENQRLQMKHVSLKKALKGPNTEGSVAQK